MARKVVKEVVKEQRGNKEAERERCGGDEGDGKRTAKACLLGLSTRRWATELAGDGEETTERERECKGLRGAYTDLVSVQA